MVMPETVVRRHRAVSILFRGSVSYSIAMIKLPTQDNSSSIHIMHSAYADVPAQENHRTHQRDS